MGLTKPRAAQIFNLDYKQATRVVTVSNVTLSGGAPVLVDGITLSVGDRILVIGQSTGSQNGIYQVSVLGTGIDGTWVRTSDGNETGEIEAGMIVMVTEGTIYADTQWKLITDDPITVGVTTLTFVQNYFANSINAGTSNVTVTTNANITISSAGTANVLTVSNTGAFVNGVVSATGNVTGNYILGNGALLTGVITSVANINNGTSNVTVVSSGGNVTVGVGGTGNVAVFANNAVTFAANLLPAANVTYSLGSNTARWQDLWIANSTIYLGDAVLGAIGNTLTVNGANVLTGNAGFIFSTTGNVIGGNLITTGIVSATGNATTGNLLTAGVVSATGNVIGGNLLTAGLISATGNITGGNVSGTRGAFTNLAGTLETAAQPNITSVGTLTSLNSGAISSSGNVTGANLLTAGLISATGAITGAALTGTSLTVTTGNITGGNLLLSGAIIDSAQLDIQTSAANANIALAPNGTGIVTVSTQVSAVGNVGGGNVRTAGLVTATGNITGGNILTGGLISATSTITSAANVVGGNITTAGLISATGNITGGNIIAGSGSGGNITGVNMISATGNITCSNLILSGAIEDSAQLDIRTTASNANIVLTPNGTGNVNTGANLSVTGNVQGGNIRTAGAVSATGNIQGNFFIGNGSQLTGIASGNAPVLITVTTISANYTIATGQNGLSVGPMTTANGVQVSVANGQRWIIL
jgi:hypothetical protein